MAKYYIRCRSLVPQNNRNCTFSNETASTVDAGWMELNELQILARQASTNNHAVAITSASMGGSGRKVGATISLNRNKTVLI